MQVNDLIFKELIKRGYSLEGNTRVWNIADSKLWYLTPDQAQAFLDLEKNKDYQREVIQKEIDLIKGNMDDFVAEIGKKKAVNIIDLGCGDGKKAVLFISEFKDKAKIRYCPVDISSYMVSKAIEKIKDLHIGEVVEFQWNISDFENLENISNLLRNKEYPKNFILLLGNTLGNFEINELLYSVRSSMKDGDCLLIGNGLDNRDPEEILRAYNNPYLDKLLGHVLYQIGFKPSDVKYGARFKNGRVEMYYTVKKDVKATFLDKTVYFNEGDQIIVAVSYKYSKDEFEEFMHLYFGTVRTYTSKDKSYAVILCTK